MKFCWSVICLWAACVIVVQGQAPLSVGYQKRVQLPVTGATAAYSLDSNVVEASAVNGVVEIVGKAPGTANIVIVTPAGVQSLAVTVPVPPPVLQPGFDPPGHEGAGENGTYEFRYNSDPGQITNSLDLRRTQGKSFTRLQLVNANLFSSGGSASAIGFPYLSYEISRPSRDLTFVDQVVTNSPLTLDGYMVRGFHLREGPWQFHGGFASIATFQGLFLTTDREYTAGISRSFTLNSLSSLQGNFYYFRNPASQQLVSSNGGVGSLVYSLKKKDVGSLLAEVGVSHGVGFAARGNYDDEKNHITGNFRTQPAGFASLAINNQHGTFADLSASRKLTQRWYGSLNLNQSNFNLPTLRQSTLTTSAQLNFKVNRYFSVNGGGSFATFQSKVPPSDRVTTVNLPLGVDYSTRHFGTGFQYQRTINFDGSGGNDYAVNGRGSAGPFQMSAYFRHDVQVPTLAAIFSQIPGLQDALDRAGIVATTPDELAQLLRNAALLETLGFTNAFTVNLAPSRNDFGASFNWIARGTNRRHVDVSYFNSNTELVQGKLSLTTASVSYSQRLGSANDIVASAALVRTTNTGSTVNHPLFSLSVQHRFFSVPGLLLPGRHGMIQGHVFRDDDSSGAYNGQSALGGVEIRLDEGRTTHSDANGNYSFHRVPFGVHRVEAKYQSDEPFFYTTSSPATADMNATVDFGINFAKGQIFGFLLNDAETGIGGITVELQGEKFSRRTQTTSNGKFSFTGLAPGTYSISTLPDSYPPGYGLQDLAVQSATVEPGKPASTRFVVKAIRSVSGRVMVYDKNLLQPVPLEGAVVRLKELFLEVKTAANGAYLFRNLSAGTYTIAVEHAGKETVRTITLPPEPANLRNVDLNAGTR